MHAVGDSWPTTPDRRSTRPRRRSTAPATLSRACDARVSRSAALVAIVIAIVNDRRDRQDRQDRNRVGGEALPPRTPPPATVDFLHPLADRAIYKRRMV